MTLSCADWNRIKFSMLSRLPRDTITSCSNHLPFLQKTFSEEGMPALDIDSMDQQTQEVKALQLNEVCMASDTAQVAIASGYGSTWDNAVKKL